MSSFSDSIFNNLDSSLDFLGSALIEHGSAMDGYVEMFKETRKQELNEIKYRRNIRASYFPGLLLVVLKKTRPISSKEFIKSDYDEINGKKVLFSQLYLGIATRGFTEHIPSETMGHYCPKRVLRFNNLRAYSEEDKEWVLKVVSDVNALNESGIKLRDAYLTLAESHHCALSTYDLEKMQRKNFVDHDNAGSY